MTEEYTNLSPISEKSKSETFSPRFLGIVIFLIVVIIGVVLYFVFRDGVPGAIQEEDPFSRLNGTIHLSLDPIGDSEVDLYMLEPVSGSLSKVFEDNDSTARRYMGKISPSGSQIAFISFPISSTFPQLMTYDFTTGESKKMTRHFTMYKFFPSWSSDGSSIAFTAHRDSLTSEEITRDETGTLDPSTWTTVTTDGVNSKRISRGTHPLWSPDGSRLLLLKNKGLYLYTIEDGSIVKALSVPEKWGETASTTFFTSLSVDKSMLAWSNFNKREILIFKINSWDPFDVEIQDEIRTGAFASFYPVFSPDNRYLTAMEGRWDEESQELIDQQIGVYDLETHSRKILMDISGYDRLTSSITDWR